MDRKAVRQASLAILIFVMTMGQCSPSRRLLLLPHHQYFPVVMREYRAPRTTSKKGICLNYWHQICGDPAAVGAVLQYNWSLTPPVCDGTNIAMVWGKGEFARLKGLRTCPAAIVLGPNEPDLRTQANMTPHEMAVEWPTLEGACTNSIIVAPAPSQDHPEWLEEFRAEYISMWGRPPRLDYLAAHCYFGTAQGCIDVVSWYVERAQRWGARGVYVTEFAFLPCRMPLDVIAGEVHKLVGSFEENPWVVGYFWWLSRVYYDEPAWMPAQGCSPALFDVAGQLTPIGRIYASEPQ